jgi:hypothetical protein
MMVISAKTEINQQISTEFSGYSMGKAWNLDEHQESG